MTRFDRNPYSLLFVIPAWFWPEGNADLLPRHSGVPLAGIHIRIIPFPPYCVIPFPPNPRGNDALWPESNNIR